MFHKNILYKQTKKYFSSFFNSYNNIFGHYLILFNFTGVIILKSLFDTPKKLIIGKQIKKREITKTFIFLINYSNNII